MKNGPRFLNLVLVFAFVFSGLGLNSVSAALPIEPKINEFSASTTGTDVEYIEVFGNPSTDYSAFTLLEIEGDSGTSTGHVDGVFSIGTTDTNGLYLANLSSGDLENGTISLLLVSGFTGALGDDIDADDDGAIDVDPPWTALIDSVAVDDGGADDIAYGTTVLYANYDGLSFPPGGASRIPDGFDTDAITDWVRNDFDLGGIAGYDGSLVEGEAYNTPGEPNQVYVDEPAPPNEPKINEFSASTTGTDVEYIEVYGDPSTDYSTYTVLEIEGDGTSAGLIDGVFPVGTTDANGFYLANLTSGDLENGTISLLLVSGFTGALGDDIDADDDGAIDVDPPWTALVDSVAVDDGGADDIAYGTTVLYANYDGLSFPPGGASRIPDGFDTDAITDWVRNDFDLGGIAGYDGSLVEGEAYNTPGEPNEVYVFVPPDEVCGDPITAIYDIQGDSWSTPLSGTEVSTEGIVVGDFQEGGKDGFFIQDALGDSDPATSDGIFVYAPSAPDVNMGDHVRVSGTATEYFDLTQIGSVSQVLLCQANADLPAPTSLVLPVGSSYDFERHEGMYVTMPQDLVISEYYNFDRYGEIVLTSERFMQYTAVNDPDVDGYDAYEYDYFLSSITLDDGRTFQNPDPAIHPNGAEFTLDNRFRGGDLVTNVTGVIDYAFSLYRVQPTQGADYTPVNLRSEAPDILEGDLKVASFNVLNYFLTLDDGSDICGPSGDLECRGADTAEELGRQRAKILSAMSVIDADVFGLMEIENDSPFSAGDAVADLAAGLNDIFGAGTYDYIDTGAIGTDAIKVALLYKPGTVTPVGDYKVLDSTVDPRFIDTKNRPTLAQDFMDLLTGEIFTVAVNHLKSKGSSCDDIGDPGLDDGAGNCNLTRLAAAEAMVDWLADETYFPESDKHLIIGDLNAYDKEDPIDAIKAGPDDYLGSADDYVDMIYHLLGEDAYGYVFDGKIGYLDYALPNKALEPYVRDVTIWHINADEPDLIDYDTSFKQDAQDDIYAPDPYRSSDHDPVIVTLDFSNNPPVAVDDAYQTAQDATLIVAAPGVLANDLDPDDTDQMQADLETPPMHGELTLNLDGSFTYVPDPGFYGVDTFTYYLLSLPPSMTRGEYIDTATVTITVTPMYQYYFPITLGD